MTDNNAALKALNKLNEELENYFRNTIIPQLFVDEHLVLRKFTPPAMKQFNLRDEHIGKPLADVHENFRFPTIIENIQQVIDSGEILEKEIQTTDMRWYQMNILPYLVRKTKKTNGVIITFMDITPRIKDLKEQEKLIADHELLLDTIAHDIKNPLTSLGIAIEMLNKQQSENRTERFPVLLKNLDSSLTKLKAIIIDLVQSRWQHRRYQAVEEMLDLENILEDVRLTLAPQIFESGTSIKYELDTTQVTFVRRKLRSILYNLLNNAIKYSSLERVPEIHIKSYTEDGYMVISVTDNGIGIDPKNQDTVFEKYNRISDSIEGNGVGLYLVKQNLISSGGRITVESELGKGTVFRVFLRLDE